MSFREGAHQSLPQTVMDGVNLNLVVGRLGEEMGMEVVGNLEVFVEGLYLVDCMWGLGKFP